MARIARISVHVHLNDLKGRVWNPAIRWTRKYAVFVKVEDDTGATGLGECWCFDTAPDALCAYLRTEVIPAYLGVEIAETDAIAAALLKRATLTARHGILASALSGMDIACHDLAARVAGIPVWRHLNREGSGQVRLYASGGLYGQGKGLAELTREMAGMAEAGFPIVKMKVGGADTLTDLARVRGVLDVLPASAKLIIDGVYTMSPDAALRFFAALPPDRIEAFQSPVAAHDITGMTRLVREGVPVMATEAEYRQEVHQILVEERAVRFLQTAPVACGGFGRLKELADLVRGSECRLSLEVSSTAVALLAAAHFAAAEDVVAHVEYHYLHQVFFNRLPWSRKGFGDVMPLPDAAGLGIALPDSETEQVFELTNASGEGAVA